MNENNDAFFFLSNTIQRHRCHSLSLFSRSAQNATINEEGFCDSWLEVKACCGNTPIIPEQADQKTNTMCPSSMKGDPIHIFIKK